MFMLELNTLRSLRVPLVIKKKKRSCFDLPGFPPIPGQKAPDADQGFLAALVAADKLVSTDNAEVADEDDDEEVGFDQNVLN